ncbi:MAG: hypothetical protein AUG51_07530 [Acidobacteria bacterium 13_1_20CM_3_53_8]|nr:MAG: hypothetical protein AUG51_07530 [Acidobacteria bacterium 13_1_20CM_3_53_8]
MLRKYFFFSIAAIAVLLLGTIAASAQQGELRGHVVAKQADGTTAPVPDALIDVYRTDIPGKYNTKTDRKGHFVFAGLPYTGKYVIAVSAQNMSPNILPDVLAGRGADYEIVLGSGDGRRFTEAEIRSAATSAASTGGNSETAEQRSAREANAARTREVEDRNKHNQQINEVLNRTFTAGNAAIGAHNYDEAIKQFDEGLAADPEQAALLTSRSVALRMRGVDRYNAAAQSAQYKTALSSGDTAAMASLLEPAKSDIHEAVAAVQKAVAIVKAETVAPTDAAAQARHNGNLLAALKTQAEAMRLYAKYFDLSTADATFAAYQEYVNAETDPANKLKAQLAAAQVLLDASQGAKAAEEFKKILAANPDNIDAELGLGLSLFNTGVPTNFQEAANHIQKFIDNAPDTNPLKQSAREALDYLKSQNVRPERGNTTTGGQRRRRP